MDIYTKLVSGIIFPLHERLKRHNTVSVRKAMERSQWWLPEQLREYQIQRLRDFLLNVKERVPYYQHLFNQAGFEPAELFSVEQLRSLPFLTKTLIRSNTDDLKARGATSLSRFNTGGSSGEPLIFYIGNERVSHDVAAKWRATRWWDVDIGDREIVVWGSPIELGAQDRVRHLRDKLIRTKLIAAFDMSPDKVNGFLAMIRDFRPKMLFGYPSSLALIAKTAERNKQRMDDLGIRTAFVTSEKLYDEQRLIIETVFGCRVANGYGGRDAGFIAHQCPQGSMHITAEDIIVELVDSVGNNVPVGQPGEIVVTHMATGEFPFIRYRTGDVGVLSDQPCACGRGLPVLKDIQGRATDFVVASNGTVMHGLALIYILRDLPSIRSFKIVQESLELTRVIVCPEGELPRDDESKIVDGFKARLGQNVKIDVQVVDHIGPEKSGKYRYVVSHVPVA